MNGHIRPGPGSRSADSLLNHVEIVVSRLNRPALSDLAWRSVCSRRVRVRSQHSQTPLATPDPHSSHVTPQSRLNANVSLRVCCGRLGGISSNAERPHVSLSHQRDGEHRSRRCEARLQADQGTVIESSQESPRSRTRPRTPSPLGHPTDAFLLASWQFNPNRRWPRPDVDTVQYGRPKKCVASNLGGLSGGCSPSEASQAPVDMVSRGRSAASPPDSLPKNMRGVLMSYRMAVIVALLVGLAAGSVATAATGWKVMATKTVKGDVVTPRYRVIEDPQPERTCGARKRPRPTPSSGR